LFHLNTAWTDGGCGDDDDDGSDDDDDDDLPLQLFLMMTMISNDAADAYAVLLLVMAIIMWPNNIDWQR